MTVLVGWILPYLACAVFLLGMGWRTGRWLARPVPFALTLTEGQAGGAGQAVAVAKELLLFRGLLRGDRWLWVEAWGMHATLFLVLLGHVAGIASLGRQFCLLGASTETSVWLSQTAGTAAGFVLIILLLLLGLRRATSAEVRRLSAAGDYLALILLLGVALTGMLLRKEATEADLVVVRSYMAGLLTFRPVALPQSGLFVLHFWLVNLLLIWFPFSKLAHLTGGIVNWALLVRPAPTYPTPGHAVDAKRPMGGT